MTIRARKKLPGMSPVEHSAIEEELQSKTTIASSIYKEAADLDKQKVELQARIGVVRKAT